MDHTLIPESGTVKSVRLPEPERGEPDPIMDGSLPALSSPVVVELHGHTNRYVVRAVPTEHGPVLAELRVLGDGPVLDHAGLASFSPRRLAHAAMQWLSSAGGMWATPGDSDEAYAQPESADAIRRYNRETEERHADVAGHAEAAVRLGVPVRKYVAEKMHVSVPTVARYLRAAREAGYLADTPLPKIQPEQGGEAVADTRKGGHRGAPQQRPNQSS